MNKHFFNFKININLSEILKILEISFYEVLSVNNSTCNLDKIYINDFVSFKDFNTSSKTEPPSSCL